MYRSSRFSRSTSARSSRSLDRRTSTLPVSERDPLPGIRPPGLRAPCELDDRIRGRLEACDLIADPAQAAFRPASLGPQVVEGSVEGVHAPPPFLTLLHVEQDGLRVDHAGG